MLIPLWPLTIKLDVLFVQIVNVFLLLFIFKKLFGDILLREILEKKQLIQKLKNTQVEYNQIIADAESKKLDILHAAYQEKNDILSEAKVIWEKNKQHLIAQGQEEAWTIIENAQQHSKKMEKTLLESWESDLKHSTAIVVKKLIHTDKELQSQYLGSIISSIKK